MAAPFALLYVRPEIASGYYHIPRDPAETTAVPDGGDAPPQPLLPGVPPEEAAFFFSHGKVVNQIKQRLDASGFALVDERVLRLSKPHLRRFFFTASSFANDDEQTRAGFLDRFAAGPTLVLLLALPSGNDPDAAVVALQALVGPEDPVLARKHALGAGIPVDQWPLRAVCGVNTAFPGVHASSNLDCAIRERLELFPPRLAPLESAVVALFPPFLAALPDAKATVLSHFNRHGVVVTSALDCSSLSPQQLTAITTAEFHVAVSDADRETFRSQLHSTTDGGASLLLRVVGFNIEAVLRQIFGPASVSRAQRFFPDSLRAQLTSAPFVVLEDQIQSREHSATCVETGVFVTLRHAAIEQLVPEVERIDATFAIIKPNAACDPHVVEQILEAIHGFGFSIEKQRRLRLTRAQAASFYAEHTGKGFFERLLDFMTSGEIVALQLARKLAVPMWRALMGPTNCLVARETHPWTLRARFGIDGTKNATHGSDALASARRELRFFFGATTHNAPVVSSGDGGDGGELTAARVANSPLVLPYSPADSLEKVVVRGLDAMLHYHAQQPLGGPLAACQWLGEWLLQQSELQSKGGDAPQTKTASTRPGERATAARAAPSQPDPPASTIVGGHSQSHRVVAIVVDASVLPATKQAMQQLIRQRSEAAGYAFVDAGGPTVSVDGLVRQVHDAGRRRVVLFDWTLEKASEAWAQKAGAYHITSLVTIATEQAGLLTNTHDPCVLHTLMAVPVAEGDVAAALRPLFRSVVEPSVWIVDDDAGRSPDDWRRLAGRFGVAFIAFDTLVSSEITRERDPNGVFTQWQRTRASIPIASVLEAVKRVVLDPARMDVDAATHQFLLFGFSWASVDGNTLENHIGRITGVFQVGSSPREWSRAFLKRGSVYEVAGPLDTKAVRVLGPHVTFVVGNGDVSALRKASTHQGAAWVDVASLPATAIATPDTTVATLQRLILAGRQRVVLCGFPRSKIEAELFLQRIVSPRTIVLTPQKTSLSPEQSELLAFLQQASPHVIQSVVPPTELRVRGLLHCQSVAFAVGETSNLDATVLRASLEPLGFHLIDLRRDKSLSAIGVLDCLSCCASSRCLVLGGPSTTDYFRALHAALGTALGRVFVLKQRKQQAPPKPRADDDDFDSDEEAEREKQRQREATTLSPELTQLVQVFSAKPVVLRVDVVSFLTPSQASDTLSAALQPRIVAVVGHNHTFYREAVRGVCLAQQLPFVDLAVGVHAKTPQSNDFTAQLGRLHSIVAACCAATIVVDGFPRGLRADDDTSVPPYAAQQVLLLEEKTARLPLVVRFRATLDVLLEKKSASVSRNALEDAQDALEESAGELVEYFRRAKGVRSLRDVSCERELHDAQDEFTDVLRSQGIVLQD